MKNLKPLNKAEMKKVTGGGSFRCTVDADCIPSQMCCNSTLTCVDSLENDCPEIPPPCYATCKDALGSSLGVVAVSSCVSAMSACIAVYSNTASTTCAC
jgi:hypothetical protein